MPERVHPGLGPAEAVEASAERRHKPDDGLDWSELFDFQFVAPEHGLAGHVSVWLWPAVGRAWYWAGLLGACAPLVTIVETELALPRAGLELRGSGVWADHNCETPLQHWSVGLEAFAVGLEDPAEVFGTFRGERVPIGLDLEWESEPGEVQRIPSGYELSSCAVHGEVLVGPERYEVACRGGRSHCWGAMLPYLEDWPAASPLPVRGDELLGWSPASVVTPAGEALDLAWALCGPRPGRWRCVRRSARPT